MNLDNIPQFSKEKVKDVNMKLVCLGNTRILIDYAQNPPQTLTTMYAEWPKLLLIDPTIVSL